jgi:hypothetical protein
MKDLTDLITPLAKTVVFILGISVLMGMFGLLELVTDTNKKAEYNACRDTGRGIISCVTGLK